MAENTSLQTNTNHLNKENQDNNKDEGGVNKGGNHAGEGGDGVDGSVGKNGNQATNNHIEILPYTTDEDLAEIRDKDMHV